MGRIVCLTDPIAAAARNAQMLADRAAGAQRESLSFPPLTGGLFTGAPCAGQQFPQPKVNDRLFDDALGNSFWLIGSNLMGDLPPGVRAFPMDSAEIAPFAVAVSAFLAEQGTEAVLVRPDRHIFGCGSAAELLAALKASTFNAIEQV
jgi:3-(3-hydroxy-phenyl)propionate hydroxylase